MLRKFSQNETKQAGRITIIMVSFSILSLVSATRFVILGLLTFSNGLHRAISSLQKQQYCQTQPAFVKSKPPTLQKFSSEFYTMFPLL